MTKGAKPDAWMPLFIGDYLKDTARLSTEQHGAYLLLIMDYWTNGAPADDDEELAAITRLDLKTWRRHRTKLERFFQIEDGRWMHKRITEELEAAQGKSDKAAEKARLAAEARWAKERDKHPASDAPRTGQSNAPGDAQAHARSMLEECPSPSPSPIEEGPNGPVGSAAPPDVHKSDIDRLWGLAPRAGRERSSRKDVDRALKAAVRRGHGVDTIAAGVEAYYASEGATKNGGEYAKGLHRLIENDRWQEFAPASDLFVPPAADGDDAFLRPTDTRQRLWMQDFKTGGQWLDHVRGPKPGEAGCRVSPEIQREFGVEPAKPQSVNRSAA